MKSKSEKSLFVGLIKKIMEDPTYKERAPLREAAKEDAAPVLRDLHAADINVGELNALRPAHPQIELAIPILVRWLGHVKNPYVKMTIVRRLSIPKARGLASKVFLREFESISDPNDSLKWAIGNGLSLTAAEEDVPALIKLAGDRKHGRAREMIVVGLASFDKPAVRRVLMRLLKDRDVDGHALAALRKLRAEEAKFLAKSFLNDSRPWVRREARRMSSEM